MTQRLSRSAAGLAAALLAAVIAPVPSLAAETVVMTAGAAGEAMVTFSFDKDHAPPLLTIRTEKAGVAGSVFSIYVDSATEPTFRHVYVKDECRFPDGGVSTCTVIIPQTEPSYADIVAIFKAGKNARLVIEDAGAMVMDTSASLIGFTKSFDE